MNKFRWELAQRRTEGVTMQIDELMRSHGITEWSVRRTSRKGNKVVYGSTSYAYDTTPWGGWCVITDVEAVVDSNGKVLDYQLEHDEYAY
jgi:hypothetical protein